LTKLHIV